MPTQQNNNKYLLISTVLHVGVLLAFIISVESSSVIPVVENTNKNDVISAVVLGDTDKSKIVPQEITPPPPPAQQEVKRQPPKVNPKLIPPPMKPAILKAQKDAIPLKVVDKKKVAEEKAKDLKKQHDELLKNLLADMEKQTVKQKQVKQKDLQTKFQKMLKAQAEKSLRQQLLNEDIKVAGTQTRESRGVVDKYKALIIQSISEHWLIPSGARKNLYCELMIRLAPGGMVLDVQVTKSSGDPSLDSSARAAVLKASPLPVPNEAKDFAPFKEFVLRVKPDPALLSQSGG